MTADLIDPPLVTIGVASYNAGPLIDVALASVLAQDCLDLCEIVVLDDASTDDTAARASSVLASSGVRHRVVAMSSNQMSQGRAPLYTLAGLARGRYLARLDADDYWLGTDKLRRQLDLLDANPSVPLCCTAFTVVGDHGGHGAQQPADRVRALAPLVPAEELRNGCFVQHSSVVVRTDAVRGLGDLGGWQKLATGDYAAWGFIASGRTIGLLPDALLAYRAHEGGSWQGRPPEERLRDVLDAVLWLAKFDPDVDNRREWSARAARLISADVDAGPFARAARERVRALEACVARLEGRYATAKDEQVWARSQLQTARFHVERLVRERDWVAAQRDQLATTLQAITKSRGYRLVDAVRNVIGRGRS